MIEINLEKYEGPMDLLLKLIEKNKINIYDIPIKEITEQYIAYIEIMDTDAENIAEFIVMASTLLEIKSKMLIPNFDEDLEEDPREELVQKILEYKRIKIASKFLSELREESSKSIPKLREEVIEVQSVNINLGEDIDILSKIFISLLEKTLEDDEISFEHDIINREEYPVEECINEIRIKLHNTKRSSIRSLLSNNFSRQEVITVFIAVLELIRQSIIIAYQAEDDIYLEYK